MRLAILHSGDLQRISLGGIDRYVKNLITFSDDGEITLFGTTVAGEHEIGKGYKKVYRGKHYTFIAICDNTHKPLSLRYMISEIKWLSVLSQYDLVYAQRVEYCMPFLLRKRPSNLIQMIHGSSAYDKMFWGMRKAAIHAIVEYASIKTAMKTYIIQNRDDFGVPYYKKKYRKNAHRISYGRNIIDLSVYHGRNKGKCRNKLGLKEDAFYVIYCGRIEDMPKRTHLLPVICESLQRDISELGIIVIGEGSDKDELEMEIQSRCLLDRFRVLGYIEETETIAEYYCSADVSLNLSVFEGTCTSILESIACGTPVVATDAGDVRECINNGENGIVIRQSTDEQIVEDIALAIKRIYHRRPHMNEVYKRYGGSNVVEELRKTCNEVCVLLQRSQHEAD